MTVPFIVAGPARRADTVDAGRLLLIAAIGAVALLAALDLAADPQRLSKALGDTDDATRLVQVRGLLAGMPWFDTTLPEMGAPQPLVSHWSRLVDLPIALLMKLFSLVLGAEQAETATRFVWPLVLLVPLALIIGREAGRQAGRQAGLFAILIVVTSLSGLVQFMPGRIDHHNAMILGAVAGVILTAQGFEDPRHGPLAGIAFGMSLAVGYEALALIGPSVALACLYALVTGRAVDSAARMTVALTATLALALIATTAPSRLLVSHCDALSLNLVLLAGSGAAGMALVASRGHGWPLWRRLAVPCACGLAGILLYGLAEPACLNGPFGQIDPAIRPIWLDHVPETKPLAWLFRRAPEAVVDVVLFFGLALAAAAFIWRTQRDMRLAYRFGILVLAILLAAWQIKLLPYATFLAAFPIAVAIAGFGANERGPNAGPATAKRIGLALLANQLVLLAVAAPIGGALRKVDPDMLAWQRTVKDCLATSAFAPLAALPPGLVLSDDDLGPYIAALTPLRATSGPYHRLDKSIVLTNRILEGTTREAEARLKELRADYVAICPGLRLGATPPGPDGSGPFEAELWAGKTPSYLEPVPLAAQTPIKVWRVRK